MLNNNNTDYSTYLSVLKKGYKTLLPDTEKYSACQRFDESLFSEVDDFIELLRRDRRVLLRKLDELNDLCDDSVPENIKIQVSDLEYILEELESIETELLLNMGVDL